MWAGGGQAMWALGGLDDNGVHIARWRRVDRECLRRGEWCLSGQTKED